MELRIVAALKRLRQLPTKPTRSSISNSQTARRAMRFLTILLLCLCLALCLGSGQARRLQREANPAPEPQQAAADQQLNENPLGVDVDDDDDDLPAEKEAFISDATTTEKPRGIVSVKSRAIAMDRGLCQTLSPQHPHFPKCHQYCKRLEHWIGQCWRESCHCIS